MRRKRALAPLCLVIAFALAAAPVACGGQAQQTQQQDGGDGPRVVATYSILGDLVENVGGENVEVETLVGPGGDAHTFEPAPGDSKKLSEADVVFENGLGFETWLDDLHESSGSEAERVVVSEDIDPLRAEEADHDDEEERGHDHGELDPHVWHDPNNAAKMAVSIRDALSEAAPDNAEAYERNAEDYAAELEDLDADVTAMVEGIPEENRKLVTSHDTFGYFARRYGFEVSTALDSFSTEASDPSAGEVAELVEEIERSGVPAVFAENVTNPDLMRRVAAEAGVELAPTLYTDALGEPGSDGDTYLKMVRYNATTIAEALGE